jgi:xanthine dehydrogenase accessory factor
MTASPDILDLVNEMKARHQPFALATVVRTVAATAAKAGAKAVILADGTIEAGWIGGGCARGAVVRAAREALADGQARLVSIQPQDLLDARGVRPGDEREGVKFARNMCPSHGTMDVFVEPVLPRPRVAVLGASPVAIAVADLAPRFGFAVAVAAPAADQAKFAAADRRLDGSAGIEASDFVVVATQGRGDAEALAAALASGAAYVAFVGSVRKASALTEQLAGDGAPRERLAQLKAPAGLDIGAITPEEIALSILAEIVAVRRRGQRIAA